jgi:pimeloyl-ACP methyl ester carboxylesterase
MMGTMKLLLLWTLFAGHQEAAAFFFNAQSSSSSQIKIPAHVKLLILPGFGNDSVDYTMDRSLVSSLEERGWKPEQIRVLPVQRSDWLQVFLRGALDWQFWTATAAPTRPAFAWYLERISEQIAELCENNDGDKVILVGHSAGGWLGRAAIGFGSKEDNENPPPPALRIDLSKVAGLVTLGAPNLPPPPGVMDMTRGALKITNELFPGAYHAPSLFYVTAMGLSVTGKKQERTSSPSERTSGFAYNSYEAVCGDGATIGDGVVPLCAGHLEDALQVSYVIYGTVVGRQPIWKT